MGSKTSTKNLNYQLTSASLSYGEQITAQSFISKNLGWSDNMRLHQQERDRLLAFCDAAAELWEGQFDAAEDIRQMRQERDEQISSARA